MKPGDLITGLQVKRLHPETLGDNPSVRSLEKSNCETKISEYGFNLIIRGLTKFFTRISAKAGTTYPDLEQLINQHQDLLISDIKSEIPADFEGTFPGITDVLLKILFVDNIFMESVLTIAAYWMDPERQNYVISQDFWSEFKNVSLSNLRFRDLHRGSGYIFLPSAIEDDDGTKYTHYYFICGKIDKHFKVRQHRMRSGMAHNDEILMVTLLSEGDARRTLGAQLPADQDLKLADYLQNYVDHIFDFKGVTTTTTREYGKFTAQIMNLLAYLASGQPDIRSFRNKIEYRGQSNVPVNRHRDLSLLDINLIGFNWKKERQLSSEGWSVRPHLRWQRYGVERSLVKLITIAEHQKQWTKASSISPQGTQPQIPSL